MNMIKSLSSSAKVLLATLVFVIGGAVALPFIIALLAKGLLFIFTKPLMALMISSAFLIGMFVNEKLK